MANAFEARQIVRFGPFEVNLRTGELRKRGIRIALQEQPLRILSALLDASGGIVTRQELCRLLWPDGTFVDFEHSLNAAVRRLPARERGTVIFENHAVAVDSGEGLV